MIKDGISTIGTLGNDPNDVTCSILAAKSLTGEFTIAAFSEFEFAAKFLITDNIDAMIVPGAYPNISKFIMNEQLVVTDVFTYTIPPLVFASKNRVTKSEYDILYNHPATNPLLNDIGMAKWHEQKNVSSNTVACLRVLESEYACCAITNAACADKYGLFVHKIIRDGINMPFVIFTKKRRVLNHESKHRCQQNIKFGPKSKCCRNNHGSVRTGYPNNIY